MGVRAGLREAGRIVCTGVGMCVGIGERECGGDLECEWVGDVECVGECTGVASSGTIGLASGLMLLYVRGAKTVGFVDVDAIGFVDAR